MIPERLRLWAAALREPGRKQCSGAMNDSEGRQCCLDVAVDVYNAANPDEAIAPAYRRKHYATMPYDVAGWFGVAKNPELQNAVGDEDTACSWNDGRQATFGEIAEMVDRLADTCRKC